MTKTNKLSETGQANWEAFRLRLIARLDEELQSDSLLVRAQKSWDLILQQSHDCAEKPKLATIDEFVESMMDSTDAGS
jgi:hypothetical protein